MDKYMIKERINALRSIMKAENISAFMIPTSDYHNSEYVGDFFKVREFFSGFTGSNGTLVVKHEKAGLWTDGRYFIQAEKELEGTGITLFKMGEPGVPKISDYLLDELCEGDILAFDGRVVSAEEGIRLRDKLSAKKIGICSYIDPANNVWDDRPSMSDNQVIVLPNEVAGCHFLSKLEQVRKAYNMHGADGILISKLDDIMWLLNIRGTDVECNPVALSFLYVDDRQVVLFIQKKALDEEVSEYLKKNNIKVIDYFDFEEKIIEIGLASKILVDQKNTSYRVYELLKDKTSLIDKTNPTEYFKAVKNPIELLNMRNCYIEDSAVLTRYIFWLKNKAKLTELDEYSASKKLDEMRGKISGFIDLSFPTIGAYKENGAIVHYEPRDGSAKKLGADGLFLVDSGGQYLGGTTDVTRTIVLGNVSDEIKKHYTLVVAGMLRLAATVFKRGCTGRNLDIIAREPLWREGLDFNHGTGHGIGYILNVHEGPQSIRWRYISGLKETPFAPGMIISDEPGIYIEGSHGIRIENIIEVITKSDTLSDEYLGFSHLTFVPIDLEAIDAKYLEERDRKLLNSYHRAVYEKIVPFMESDEEKDWLKEATKNI